jgi:hypothetical protein
VYLNSTNSAIATNPAYQFKDERTKALNEYSSQLIRELIIPKLTKEVNTSKKYAALRQVFYSLVLSRWFKARFRKSEGLSPKETPPFYISLIDSHNLNGLTSKQPWSKTTYFKEYQKSFNQGEYNIKEQVYTPTGQVIRSYFSGGFAAQEIPIKGMAGAREGNNNPFVANSSIISGGDLGSIIPKVAGSPLTVSQAIHFLSPGDLYTRKPFCTTSDNFLISPTNTHFIDISQKEKTSPELHGKQIHYNGSKSSGLVDKDIHYYFFISNDIDKEGDGRPLLEFVHNTLKKYNTPKLLLDKIEDKIKDQPPAGSPIQKEPASPPDKTSIGQAQYSSVQSVIEEIVEEFKSTGNHLSQHEVERIREYLEGTATLSEVVETLLKNQRQRRLEPWKSMDKETFGAWLISAKIAVDNLSPFLRKPINTYLLKLISDLSAIKRIRAESSQTIGEEEAKEIINKANNKLKELRMAGVDSREETPPETRL